MALNKREPSGHRKAEECKLKQQGDTSPCSPEWLNAKYKQYQE